MKTAIYKQPKRTFKKVWVGGYGGHYSALVFFKKKPKLSGELMTVDPYNKPLIIGAMWLCDFEELYGLDCISEILDERNLPLDIEINKVTQIMLEATYDKYGDLVEYKTHADGY